MERLGRVAGRTIAFLRHRVAIDTRTLAVFRIAIGVLIIADLVARAPRFTYFYTDNGVVPRALAHEYTPDHAFSFYFFSTDPNITLALFLLQGLFAVQLIIGYQTRIAAILSFLFIVSLDHRNPLVTSYADTLFRFLAFWAMFLPLGERWSIDAIHRSRPARPVIANLASFAILLQIVYMYFVNGLHKATSEVWRSTDAILLIFGLDDITFLLGDSLRGLTLPLRAGGLTWFVILLLSPMLILLTGRLRILFASLLFIGHASFAVTVRIGAFPYVGMAGVLLFAQPRAWEEGSRLLRWARLESAATRLYLGVVHAGHVLARWLPRFHLPLGEPQRVFAGSAQQALVAVLFVSVLVIPSMGRPFHDAGIDNFFDPVYRQNRDIISVVGVHQPPWTIFAPDPRSTDRWYVFVARTADGDLIDIYNDRELSFDRPYRQLQKQYPTYRERFYMNSVRRAGMHRGAPPVLAEYLCRDWREKRGVELTHINMYVINETVILDTVRVPEDRETNTDLVYLHGCGDLPAERIPLPDGLGGAAPAT